MLNRIYYLLGKILESKKKWEMALRFYRKIPNSTKTNYRTAFCYKQRKDYGNAIFFFKKAISKEPTKIHWLLNLIESLLALKKEKETIVYIKKCLKLNLNDKERKKLLKLKQELHQGLPELNTYIDSIRLVESEYFEINILGNVNNFDSIPQEFEFSTKQNKLDLLPLSHTINLDEINIDKNGIFRIKVLIPLKLFQINSDIINYKWNFYIKSKVTKTSLQYFKESNDLIRYKNIDLISYKTKNKIFSLVSIRKETNILNSNKTKITLVISRVNEEAFFIENTIKLANILISLNYHVTLVALDFNVSSNQFAISPKVNFNYITTNLLTERNETINFISSDSIPSKKYIKKLENFFSNIDTDILYTPIFGDFIFNKILKLSSDKTYIVAGEYNKRRYTAYVDILNTQEKNRPVSLTEVIKRVHTKHFFENLNLISAIHLIYPEVEKLFSQITDIKIISNSFNEANMIKIWDINLSTRNQSKEENSPIFY